MQNQPEPVSGRKNDDAEGLEVEEIPDRRTLTLGAAFEVFDRANADGQIPDRRNGKPKVRAAGKVNVIRSHVRRAVARAARVPDASNDEVDRINILPYLTTLTEFAGDEGDEGTRKIKSNIKLFRATVLGQEYETSDRHGHANRPPVTAQRALPTWRPLYEALEKDAVVHRQRRSFPAQLLALQDLALVNDIIDPHDLPDSVDTIADWAKSAGLKRTKLHAMTAAFRSARDLVGDDALPTLYQQVNAGDRGLRSLPDLRGRIADSGCAADPRDMTAIELIDVLAPKLGAALHQHIRDGRRRNLSPGWEEEQIGMTGRLTASLLRLGQDTSALSFLDLFERTVEVAASDEANELLREALGSTMATVQTVTLLRHAFEEAARRSCERSSLSLVSMEETPPEDVPWYTAKVRTDLLYCFLITRHIYGAIQKHDAERWAKVEKEYERLRDDMIEYNRGRRRTGQKPKSKVLITWPQAVVIGLRHLRRRVVKADGKLLRYLERGGTTTTRAGKALLLRFDKALRVYVLVAVMLDDGLRIKNYAGARANINILPTEVERDRDGNWLRLVKVETAFRGFDHPSVSLKINVDELGAERSRVRQLTPAIVDYDLLLRYWTEVRPRDLVRRGLIRSTTAYKPDEDRYAFFIAPRTGGRLPLALRNYDPEKHIGPEPTQVLARRTGMYTTDQLSKIFGRAIHGIISQVLKRAVPAWDDPIRTQHWRGVFSAHIVRLLIASYWGGIRRDWVHACWLTDDTPETLQRSYIRIRSEVVAQKRRAGTENIGFYDAILDRMVACDESDDWATFWDEVDPAEPDDAFQAVLTGASGSPGPSRRRKDQLRKSG